MARGKEEYGFSIGGIRAEEGTRRVPIVTITGWVDDGGPQHDRPLRSDITSERARQLAASLIKAADEADAGRKSS